MKCAYLLCADDIAESNDLINLFSELRFKQCLDEDSEIKMNYILKANPCLDLKTFKSETSLCIDQL